MKNFACIFAAALLATAIAGCDDNASASAPAPSALQSKPATANRTQINLSVAITIGNHTYIPLNLPGDADQNVRSILAVLAAFEKSHSEFKVTGWSIEKQQSAYMEPAFVFGLWVDHEPRRAK